MFEKGQGEGKERAGQGRKEGEAIRQKEREALQKARKQLSTDTQEERSNWSCLGWIVTLLWTEHRV